LLKLDKIIFDEAIPINVESISLFLSLQDFGIVFSIGLFATAFSSTSKQRVKTSVWGSSWLSSVC
jgi:hypothetical protein